MKLNRLTIINFKGIKSLDLFLDGESASILGTNAAGKTSVYDAFLFLLFGKDSRGSANFSIKPIVDGEPLHNVETHVEAELLTDTGKMTLIRKYREVWSRKRGEASETFTGHESLFYVDGLPVSQTNYKKIVDSIMPEDLFRILTNPLHFPEVMKWTDRRSALFKMFGELSDQDVAGQDPDYTQLLEKAGRYSVEEYMAALKKKIRTYNQELNELPARLDEASRQILEDDDVEAARAKEESIADEIRALKATLSEDGDKDLVAQKMSIENEILQLQRKNNAHREKMRTENAERVRAAMNDLADQLTALHIPELEAELAIENRALDALNRSLENLRAKFTQVASEPYVAKEACPTCGRPFTKKDTDAAQKAFESARKARLDEINAEGRDLSAKAKEAKKKVSVASEELERRKKIRAEYEQAMKELRMSDLAPDMDGYAAALQDLTERRVAIMEAIDAAREGAKAKNAKVSQQMAERYHDLIEAKEAVAACMASKSAQERVEELRAQQASTVEAMEDAEALVALCERFIRARVSAVEYSINKHFRLVKWQLYREQINGGMEEICEATVDGVPFHDLNGAMRINAGLDIINACIDRTGKSAPIFVDNAESVVNLYELPAQVIRLVVSEYDKKLRLQK